MQLIVEKPKDLETATDEWKETFIAAAREVVVAEELILRFPNDPGLRIKLDNAWEDYRDVCRSVVRLDHMRDIFCDLPRLILSEVLPGSMGILNINSSAATTSRAAAINVFFHSSVSVSKSLGFSTISCIFHHAFAFLINSGTRNITAVLLWVWRTS